MNATIYLSEDGRDFLLLLFCTHILTTQVVFYRKVVIHKPLICWQEIRYCFFTKSKNQNVLFAIPKLQGLFPGTTKFSISGK